MDINKIITCDLHGDYVVSPGQVLKAGEKIGTCNGHPNYSPHRHFALIEATSQMREVGVTHPYVYYQGNTFTTFDPISNTPEWFNASASGFSYLQNCRQWYLNNKGVDIAGKHYYVDKSGDIFHDGTDIGTNQGIYKGSDLVTPFDCIVIDVGVTNGGLTYCYTAPYTDLPKQDNSVKQINQQGGKDMLLKFTGAVNYYNQDGSHAGQTGDGWYARGFKSQFHAGWWVVEFTFGLFWIKDGGIQSDYCWEA